MEIAMAGRKNFSSRTVDIEAVMEEELFLECGSQAIRMRAVDAGMDVLCVFIR